MPKYSFEEFKNKVVYISRIPSRRLGGALSS